MNETWNKAYSLILNCNLLLENLENPEVKFTGDNYKVIKGETLALRAMLHFDLLRLFGPVYSRNKELPAIPYYKKYSVTPNAVLSASEVAVHHGSGGPYRVIRQEDTRLLKIHHDISSNLGG